MQTFLCSCASRPALFFESTECTTCGRLTGFSENLGRVVAFDPLHEVGLFRCDDDGDTVYRQCQNYVDHQVCNGMVAIDGDAGASPLCFPCHFNQAIPNLEIPEHLRLWRKLETAKRRTLFTLNALKLAIPDRQHDPEGGLTFRFLADKNAGDHFRSAIEGHEPVFTGHDRGEITINLAEADDVARTRTKLSLGEQYRTLLGHFRHEIGHFYWDRLIGADSTNLQHFRRLFGDESRDYQQALETYYRDGAPPGWQQTYISAYATMHPWEDWAESWAHYLHMLDTLETAQNFGLNAEAEISGEEVEVSDLTLPQHVDFCSQQTPIDVILSTWMKFTVVLNSLNRSMGLQDAYPFVLYPPIREKLKCIHAVVHGTVE